MEPRKSALFALFVFVAIYLAPLGVRPLFATDEFRYAEVPREMLVSGDWITPRIAGVRYFAKPPLGYWLNAVSMQLFGENAAANRLPAALAVLASALLLAALVRRHAAGLDAAHGVRERTALLAAVVFATSLLVFGVGVLNILDSPLSFFLTGSLVAFYFGYRAETRRARLGYQLLFGVFCGLAFMTKGFLAFAVPVITIGPFLLWERRARDLLVLPWIPLATAIAVALPWALAIHAIEPDFWNRFFLVEHVERFASGETDHPEPFWFLVPFLVAGALPWTALLGATVAGLRRRGFGDPLQRFALCWAVMPFLFFSASLGKRGTYVLPCLAPLAILTALGLERYLRDKPPGPGFRRGALGLGAVLAVAAFGFLLHEAFAPFGRPLYGPGEGLARIAVIASALVWAVLCGVASRVASPRRALAAFAAGPLLLMLATHVVLPASLADERAPARQLAAWAERIPEDSVLVVGRHYVYAAAFTLKRDDLYFLRPGELDYGLFHYPEERHRLLQSHEFGDFLASRPEGEPVAFFLSKKRYSALREAAGEPAFEETTDTLAYGLYRGTGPPRGAD